MTTATTLTTLSPSATRHTSRFLLLCCFLGPTSILLAILPVSVAMPTDAKDSMRASMDFQEEATTTTSDNIVTVVDSTDHLQDNGEGLVVDAQPTKKTYNCSQSHRAHNNDSNKFQVRNNNAWWDQVCQIGLVWNQTLCRCEYELPNRDGSDSSLSGCRDYLPHDDHPAMSGKYRQRVNEEWVTRDCNLAVSGLVWNQTACRCVWATDGKGARLDLERNQPCDAMLNVTFERGLVDEAKSSFLELASGSVLALRHYSTPLQDGVNTAAYFQSALMTVWYFAGNEMSGSLRVEFRFKAEDSPLTRHSYQIMLSNGCNATVLGYTSPSLAIGYRATDRSFLLALHTASTRKAVVCTRDLAPFAWHHVSLVYEDGMLMFSVDDRPCIISSDFSGEVQKTNCPMTIGADPLEKESRYIGYLDDLVIARHCRRLVEQTSKTEEEEEESHRTPRGQRLADDAGTPAARNKPVQQSSPAAEDRQSGEPAATGSALRSDHSAGSLDKSAGSLDKSDGSLDKSARSLDRSDGSLDKSDGSLDKSDGSLDKSDGSLDKSVGSFDKFNGSVDKFVESLDTSNGSVNKSNGSVDKSGEPVDKSDGSVDKSVESIEKSDGSVDKSVESIDKTDGSVDKSATALDGKSPQRDTDDKSPRSDADAEPVLLDDNKSPQGHDQPPLRGGKSAPEARDGKAPQSDDTGSLRHGEDDKPPRGDGDESVLHDDKADDRSPRTGDASASASPRRDDDKPLGRGDSAAARPDESVARDDANDNKAVAHDDEPVARDNKTVARDNKTVSRDSGSAARDDDNDDDDDDGGDDDDNPPHDGDKSSRPVDKSAEADGKSVQGAEDSSAARADDKSVKSGDLTTPQASKSEGSVENKIQTFRAMGALL